MGESPHWDDQSAALYWVDITGRRLRRWEQRGGRVSTWPMPGYPTALALRRHVPGAIVTVGNRVCLFHPDHGLTTFCVPEPDRPDNRLNEGACDPAGRFFVGSMENNLDTNGNPRDFAADAGRLWRIGATGIVTLADDHPYGIPNTLVWREDGTLLSGDSIARAIYAYDWDAASGALSNRRMFSDEALPGVPDGSCLDADGYLWNARFGGGALVRFAPDGRTERVVELPVANPTSCTFGGPDLRTLFVTSARFTLPESRLAANPIEGAVLAIRTEVAGLPARRFAG